MPQRLSVRNSEALFFFSSRRRHTRLQGDWSSDVCSSDLIWVAEQLDLIGHIDRACGNLGAKNGPSVGELAVAVVIQRACSPGPKRDLTEFLDGSVPRLSCLPASAFSGQAYHRVAQQVSETGHVPLLYRTYSGNSSDQAVLTDCLEGLRALHESLDEGEGRQRAQRTLVRDGGFWSPQLELDLDVAGYYSLISLPLGHAAAEQALQTAAKRGAMKWLTGKLSGVRAARVRAKVGNLDRTLVVVGGQELLEGQKRGMAAGFGKGRWAVRQHA